VDLDEERIERCFKLYPWEWLWQEEFSAHLAIDCIQFIEPGGKCFLSNKGCCRCCGSFFRAIRICFRRFEFAEPLGSRYVRKPKLSREGCTSPGLRAAWWSRKTAATMANMVLSSNHPPPCRILTAIIPVFGVWVIDHEAAGLGIREDKQRITGNLSRFVPHFFSMSYENPTRLRIGMHRKFLRRKDYCSRWPRRHG